MIVTLLANRVRNIASSNAESPPPTTAMSWSRKKKPSHVAHVDTPYPTSRCSLGTLSINDCAPVATMIVLALYVGSGVSGSPTHTPNGGADRSTLEALTVCS